LVDLCGFVPLKTLKIFKACNQDKQVCSWAVFFSLFPSQEFVHGTMKLKGYDSRHIEGMLQETILQGKCNASVKRLSGLPRSFDDTEIPKEMREPS